MKILASILLLLFPAVSNYQEEQENFLQFACAEVPRGAAENKLAMETVQFSSTPCFLCFFGYPTSRFWLLYLLLTKGLILWIKIMRLACVPTLYEHLTSSTVKPCRSSQLSTKHERLHSIKVATRALL